MEIKTATAEEIAKDLFCPSCRAKGVRSHMVPMKRGAGLRCGAEGNFYSKDGWSVCNQAVWLEAPEAGSFNQYVVRPSSFPVIETPTAEQLAIREWCAAAPGKRGGRLLVVNAGPGTGKTTTMAWSTAAIVRRRGSMDRFAFLAFNRNARSVLLSKLPYEVNDVYTLNSYGGRLQGFKGEQYDTDKLTSLFDAHFAHLAPEERPPIGALEEVVELCRACCLFGQDRAWAVQTIFALQRRFTGLTEAKPDEVDFWLEELPRLLTEALAKRDVIDLGEQWSRAVTEAMARTGWHLPIACVDRNHVWTDEDVRHFAGLVREVRIGQPNGMIIDEAQDLSLGMIAFYLAASFRAGELVLIGDDKHGKPGDLDYKAGQGIYGWRGSFGGSLSLCARLWEELTGEKAKELPLSVTHRCRPEIVEAFRPLNAVLTSSRGPGGRAFEADNETAFALWKRPTTREALWITRTNREAARVFVASLKAMVSVSFRGGEGFERRLNGCLHSCLGRRKPDGEYAGDLAKLKRELGDKIAAKGGEEKCPDSIEVLLATIVEALEKSPELLRQASKLPHQNLTPGNVRRFVLHFVDRSAPRVVSNVYRCKGDEAEEVYVSDVNQFNRAWGGDEDEAAACRHVAASRAKETLVVCGSLLGVEVP